VQTTLRLRADPAEIPAALNALERWLAEAGVAAADLTDWRLLAEEALTNIVCHGAVPADDPTIELECVRGGDGVELRVEDGGRPFNPCAAQPPDLGAPVEERCGGGLGIHLMQALADELAYDYRDGRNRLTLRRRNRC
jgi:anti-sigma regulatory factor (Ser/Thr protein kinase)